MCADVAACSESSTHKLTGECHVLSRCKYKPVSANLYRTRERCYDFLNIFAEKFSEKMGIFDSKQS
jgi:hypothetical protein